MSQTIVKKKLAECTFCHYQWFTASKLYYITCPRCRHTLKIVNFERSPAV